MKTRIRPVALAVVAAVVLLTGHARSTPGPAPRPDNQPQPGKADPKKPTVMQRKLLHAQRWLEGLALNDVDRIRTGAAELRLCAKEASWQVLKTPQYEVYSNDFGRQLERMEAAAKAKNVDAAALAYVEVTLTCVKCHQHVREERMGVAPDLTPFGPRAMAGR